ncbi:MAG: DUF1700 domain-containing protein [Defluviitaleaceae bacterium]|nr:DUF1700 domain-containing protein [Defluviitaleaceae bacterium]
MQKTIFMNKLRQALGKNLTKNEREDILADYEEFFQSGAADGQTDEQICANLGDPFAIAKDLTQNLTKTPPPITNRIRHHIININRPIIYKKWHLPAAHAAIILAIIAAHLYSHLIISGLSYYLNTSFAIFFWNNFPNFFSDMDRIMFVPNNLYPAISGGFLALASFAIIAIRRRNPAYFGLCLYALAAAIYFALAFNYYQNLQNMDAFTRNMNFATAIFITITAAGISTTIAIDILKVKWPQLQRIAAICAFFILIPIYSIFAFTETQINLPIFGLLILSTILIPLALPGRGLNHLYKSKLLISIGHIVLFGLVIAASVLLILPNYVGYIDRLALVSRFYSISIWLSRAAIIAAIAGIAGFIGISTRFLPMIIHALGAAIFLHGNMLIYRDFSYIARLASPVLGLIIFYCLVLSFVFLISMLVKLLAKGDA